MTEEDWTGNMPGNSSELDGLLRAVFGSAVRLAGCQVANQQVDYTVFLAQLRHPDLEVVIKLAGPAAQMAGTFDRTAAIYRRVAAVPELPAPEVLAVDTTMVAWPWRYLILRALPGTPWDDLREQLDPVDQDQMRRQIGEAAARLHQIEFPAFGELDQNGQVAPPAQPVLPALKAHAARIIPNRRMVDLFLAVLDERPEQFSAVPGAGLCHEDLHGANLLFQQSAGQWRLSAVLDFDKAWAGPGESDLARLELWRGMTSPAFWAGYRSIRTVDDGYAQRRPVYQLLWCLEYAQHTSQHLDDTRRVCQELGCEAPVRFDL